ncbi:hypothetical protein [Nocardioides dokdonensis]|uniref:hypothetical protein n=1 Tax=Nocardioides dokdonensis TaxID=450734 RepID=UPI0012FA77FE|nr:hypothetical protein [Nocardioides dokdonensis]
MSVVRRPRRWGRVGAAALVVALLLGALTAAAVARGGPRLSTSGPVDVAGTEATGTFTVAERTVRQVRYADQGTLRYTFVLHNDGRLPVEVAGLADEQPSSRLFTPVDLVAADDGVTVVPGGGQLEVTLSLLMSGCETLSARAGAFVTEVVLRTRTAGAFADDVSVLLPEELHTGSPREAFCPESTASSRPPG